MAEVLPQCIICGETPICGFKDGMFVKRKFICSRCEAQIITTNCEEKQYPYLVEGLKKIWA